MDTTVVSIALLMMWAVLLIITVMTYFGYDVRSRGFKVDGMAAAVLPRSGITMVDYFKKRDQHPVVDEEAAMSAAFYRKVMWLFFIVLIGAIVALIVAKTYGINWRY